MKKEILISAALMLSLVFISGCSTKNPQQTDLPGKWEQADSVEAVSFQRVSNNKSPVHGTVYWAEESLEKEYAEATLSGLVAIDEYLSTGSTGTLYRAHMVTVYKNTKGVDVSKPFNLVLRANTQYSAEGYVRPAGQDVFLYNLYEVRDNVYKDCTGESKPEGTLCLTSTLEGYIPALELFRTDGQLYIVQLGEGSYTRALSSAAVGEKELNRVQEAFRTYDAVGYSRGISAAYHYQDVAAYLKGLSE